MVITNTISLRTRGFSDVQDITPSVRDIVGKSPVRNGLATVFCPGSTGAVTTVEFEEGALEDLKGAIERLVPSNIDYAHDRRWGDGNGFAHVRAAILGPSLTVPVMGGKLALGTWQQIVFIDFDNRGRQRRIMVQVLGE